MVLVDSSVWIDFLRARRTPQTDRVKASVGRNSLVTGDLILTEVLQGCTSERAFDQTLRLLGTLPIVSIVDPVTAIEAARNYRTLRARGITIRKTIDTLIASRCIADGIALLYSDRDFDPFVTHLGLRSAMDEEAQ